MCRGGGDVHAVLMMHVTAPHLIPRSHTPKVTPTHQRHPLVERLPRLDDEGDTVPPLVADPEPRGGVGGLRIGSGMDKTRLADAVRRQSPLSTA